jgi:hypothetical protein
MLTLSAVSNIVIVLGYLAAGFYLGSRIHGTSFVTRTAGALFFASCAFHHLDMAVHLSADPHIQLGEAVTSAHMLIVDVAQAVSVWVFLVSIYIDLVVRPRRVYTGNGDDA